MGDDEGTQKWFGSGHAGKVEPGIADRLPTGSDREEKARRDSLWLGFSNPSVFPQISCPRRPSLTHLLSQALWAPSLLIFPCSLHPIFHVELSVSLCWQLSAPCRQEFLSFFFFFPTAISPRSSTVPAHSRCFINIVECMNNEGYMYESSSILIQGNPGRLLRGGS